MAKGQESANKTGRKTLKNLNNKSISKRTGFGPVSAVLVTLAIYFGAQILAGYLIIQFLFLAGTGSDKVASTINASVILQFSFIFLAEIATLVFLWLFLRRRKISLAQIGIKKPEKRNFVYALPVYAVYFIVLIAVFALLQQFVPSINIEQNQEVGFETASGALPLFAVFLALVIFPAIVEEIMIRGFLYSGLKTKLPVISSAILASFIFGVAHLQLGNGENPVWIAAIDTFILSLALIWLREKTGNIWAGVSVHMLKNSLAFISLFILKLT